MISVNPYENVDWDTCKFLHSMSHTHVVNQTNFEQALSLGFRHIASSHYSPAHPIYPLETRFKDIPEGVIGSPNSEKVKTSDSGGHFNGLGSFFASPGHNWDVEVDGPYPTWREKFDSILGELQFADGGGITLNHPTDTNLQLRLDMLDHDDRVLGVEIYNLYFERHDNYYEGYSFDTFVPFWDSILSTGRRCWGFCVIDWMVDGWEPYYGRNVLLVPEVTEHNALRAYRQGAFIGVVKNTGLMFTRIVAQGDSLEVALNGSGDVTLVTNARRIVIPSVTETNFRILEGEIYARVEATDDTGERIFSQPIMYDTAPEPPEPEPPDLDRRRRAMRILL